LIYPKKPNAQTWPPLRNAWRGILQEGQVMNKLCKWGEQKAVQELRIKCFNQIWFTAVHLCFEQLCSFG